MNRKERREARARDRRTGAPVIHPSRESAVLFAQAGAALQAGRWREAESLFGRVVQMEPTHADAYNWLGVACGQQGKDREALEHFARAAALAPASADFANNLGLAQLKIGELEAAKRSFETALRLNPQLPAAHHNLGLVHQKRRDFEPAIACFRSAIDLAPNYVNARLNLGNALQDAGRRAEAIDQYTRLVQIAPNSREARFNLARALRTAGRFEEAVAQARAAVAVDPTFAEAFTVICPALSAMGHHREAEIEARRAVALHPKNPDANQALGTVLSTLGQFDEAISCFQAALAIDPDHASSLFWLTQSSKKFSTPELAARIEAALAANRPAEDVASLRFALGKIYDDLGRYSEAFQQYRAANDAAVPETWFDRKIWGRYVDRLMEIYSPAFFADRTSFANPSKRPIFIFGMPRSGTTLTEQIIASHPSVAAGGEVTAISDLALALPERMKSAERYPDCIPGMNADTARQFADGYLAALAKIDGTAARVTDKMPMNFLYLGLIALVFPHATFIHCRRDPIDTCLSCYFAKFGQNLDFSYRLENLGAYYRGYERLMAYWRSVLPIRMLDVDYEEMIAEQEAVSRRLIAHCGLEWDDRCLAFHKTDRPIATASVWQARQPIYKTSVKRWQRYESFLEPLKAALGAGLV